MFRSVFGGRTDTAQQPQQQQQQQTLPVAHPPNANGNAPGVGSLNPLSRQPQDGAFNQSPDMLGPGFPDPPSNAAPVALRAQSPGPGYPPAARKQFPELASLSAEDLRKLLTEPAEYSTFLHQIEEVKQLDSFVEDLQRSNVELAKSTLAMEAEISQLQTQCRIIRGTELAAAREQLQQSLARQQEVYSKLGPSSLVAKVQDAAKEANKESEDVQRRLAAGELAVSAFIKEYREKRKLYHVRHQTALAALASFTAGPGR